MLRPTISNEKGVGRTAWYTQIKASLGNKPMVTCPPGFSMSLGGNTDPTLRSYPYPYGGDIPLQIEDTPYKPAHPQSISLGEWEGTWDAPHVSFLAEAVVSVDDLEKGQSNESMPFPIYSAHVLWSLAVRVTRVEDDKYTLRVVGKGSHLSKTQLQEKVEYTNCPRGLGSPPLSSAIHVFIMQPNNNSQIKQDGNKAYYTKREVLNAAVDGKLTVFVSFAVPREYFSLDKIIDLNKKPTVSEDTRNVVETILRGEKPTGADWTIVGFGLGTTQRYHIHKSIFTSTSERITDNLHMFPDGLAFQLDDEYIRTVIRIAYGVEVPLPDRMTKLQTITLQRIFQDRFVKEAIPQWERDICRRALALNPRDPTPASLVELLNLLNVIWEAKYGWLPVAKRVAIGVLADMVHLNARSSVFDFVQNTILPRIPDSNLCIEHLPGVLGSMMLHLRGVSNTRKRGVYPVSEDLASGDAPTVSQDPTPTVPDQPNPTVPQQSTVSPSQRPHPAEEAESLTSLSDSTEEEKKIEIDEDTVEKKDTVEAATREDWYDAESGGVENPEENEWTCTIS